MPTEHSANAAGERFDVYPLGNKTVCDTDNRFESLFGYHRAVKKGPFVFVSGTTALLPSGEVEHPTNAGEQAMVAMSRGMRAAERLVVPEMKS